MVLVKDVNRCSENQTHMCYYQNTVLNRKLSMQKSGRESKHLLVCSTSRVENYKRFLRVLKVLTILWLFFGIYQYWAGWVYNFVVLCPGAPEGSPAVVLISNISEDRAMAWSLVRHTGRTRDQTRDPWVYQLHYAGSDYLYRFKTSSFVPLNQS